MRFYMLLREMSGPLQLRWLNGNAYQHGVAGRSTLVPFGINASL
jgi:hypothetical protein